MGRRTAVSPLHPYFVLFRPTLMNLTYSLRRSTLAQHSGNHTHID